MKKYRILGITLGHLVIATTSHIGSIDLYSPVFTFLGLFFIRFGCYIVSYFDTVGSADVLRTPRTLRGWLVTVFGVLGVPGGSGPPGVPWGTQNMPLEVKNHDFDLFFEVRAGNNHI